VEPLPELSDIVANLIKKRRSVVPHNQGAPILGDEDNKGQRHTRLAGFCEAISHAIYGGDARPTITRPQPDGNGTYQLVPDLVNARRRLIVETKSLVYARSMNLFDRQITGYLLEQLTRPTYRISFVWIRHNLKGEEGRKDADELFTRVAQGPLVAISLPLSAMWDIHAREPDGKTRYNTGNGFCDCTVLNPAPQRKLYHDILGALADLGLNPKAYTVRYERVNSLSVGSYRLAPFPLVTVRDRDHNAWFERLARWEPPAQFEGWIRGAS
jgi:hypothetical protein